MQQGGWGGGCDEGEVLLHLLVLGQPSGTIFKQGTAASVFDSSPPTA